MLECAQCPDAVSNVFAMLGMLIAIILIATFLVWNTTKAEKSVEDPVPEMEEMSSAMKIGHLRLCGGTWGGTRVNR